MSSTSSNASINNPNKIANDPVFEMGMEIETELSHYENGPRWTYENLVGTGTEIVDNGYSGVYVTGIIDKIYPLEGIVNYYFMLPDNSVCSGVFVLANHPLYRTGQFSLLPGYPIPKVRQVIKKICTCGCDSVYGKGNKVHTSYCDLLVK